MLKKFNQLTMKKVNPNKKICRKPQGYCYWTKERCLEEAKKYKSRSEFGKNSGTAYTVAVRKKWLDEICSHMEEIKKPSGYWTKEKLWEETRRYDSRSLFRKNSSGAYYAASKRDLLDEICSHMTYLTKPNGY